MHKEELDFLRGEKERLEAERDEWRGKALDADSANERLHAAMNSGSITINSQGVSAISNGETWTYKAFDLPESGTIQDILIEKNTGLEMAVAILTADRDNLKEAKAKAEYEAQNFAKDRDAWKEAAEEKGAELIELRGAILDLQATRTECTCHTEDNRYYECQVCEIARLKRDLNSLQKTLATAREAIQAQVKRADALEQKIREMEAQADHTQDFCADRSAEKQALEERVRFLEAELDQFDARGIERLKAEMDKADRLKSELEEVRAAFISITGYKDRVRAVVGQLVKVASSE